MNAAQKISPEGRSTPSQTLRLTKKPMITKYLPLVRFVAEKIHRRRDTRPERGARLSNLRPSGGALAARFVRYRKAEKRFLYQAIGQRLQTKEPE